MTSTRGWGLLTGQMVDKLASTSCDSRRPVEASSTSIGCRATPPKSSEIYLQTSDPASTLRTAPAYCCGDTDCQSYPTTPPCTNSQELGHRHPAQASAISAYCFTSLHSCCPVSCTDATARPMDVVQASLAGCRKPSKEVSRHL